MHTFYILYSPLLDQYYIGETQDFKERLVQHNTGFFKNSSTSKSSDWHKYLTTECLSRSHARKVEAFVKRQKSRRFIESLKSDPVKLRSILEVDIKKPSKARPDYFIDVEV